MAQAKKKSATKTAKKSTTARKKSCTRTTKCKGISNQERMHIYIITAMSIIAAILLCADIAMVIV